MDVYDTGLAPIAEHQDPELTASRAAAAWSTWRCGGTTRSTSTPSGPNASPTRPPPEFPEEKTPPADPGDRFRSKKWPSGPCDRPPGVLAGKVATEVHDYPGSGFAGGRGDDTTEATPPGKPKIPGISRFPGGVWVLVEYGPSSQDTAQEP